AAGPAGRPRPPASRGAVTAVRGPCRECSPVRCSYDLFMTALGSGAKALLDAANYVVVATSNTDGSPQTSVMWATHDGDELLLSTVQGRKKETNWLLDPRVSVLILDRDNPYHYVEVRGSVQMTTDGGPELIERLSQIYR